MKKLNLALMATAMTAATISLATPAMAKPSPVDRQGAQGCPSGWEQGSPRSKSGETMATHCYARSSDAPTVSVVATPQAACPSGMSKDQTNGFTRWCSSQDPQSRLVAETQSGQIAKTNILDRCPVSFYSDPDLKNCISIATTPPATRAKGSAPCKAGELEEWGIWCTSNTSVVTKYDASQASYRDVNTIYGNSGGKQPNQGTEVYNTPSIKTLFGGDDKKAADTSTGSTAAKTESAIAQCDTSGSGSASGAAVGGAVAGQAGAVLGSALGGLGKKKKKKNAC